MPNMSHEKKKESWLAKFFRRFLSYSNKNQKQSSSIFNPFLERTIEHWLSHVNELGYQMPFCQLLLSEGYTVLQVSKHTAFEQGKDIIAIDKYDTPCGFQLKGGNITSNRWRNEIKGEIEALRDLTIVHPSIHKNKKHFSYLVTNGELEGTVRFEIDNLNNGKWKDNPLRVITHGVLLKKFIKISSSFAPQQIKDYKIFLDLYFSEGKELIGEEKYTSFIRDVLRLNNGNLSKEERKRSIAAAVLFSGYILSAFKKENNHVSILKILTLLSAYIFAVVERYNLTNKYWFDSFRIVWREMMSAGELLQQEVNQDGLINLVTSIFDGELGVYRRYLAVSHLFAYKTAQLIEGDQKWKDIITDEFFLKLKETLKVWGEAALFPFILIFLTTNKVAKQNNTSGDFYKPLLIALELIIRFNGRKSETGMVSPYYNIETIIKRRFGLLEEPIDENFTRRSFLIDSFVTILARHNKRKELENCWREITYIAQENFIPDQIWQHFFWRCEKGENKSAYPKQTQNWKELVNEANKIDLKQIPAVLQKHPYFLPFFLLTYPHRISSNYVKFLDEVVKNIQ